MGPFITKASLAAIFFLSIAPLANLQSTVQNSTALSLLSVGVNALENNRYLETAANPGAANNVVDPNEDTVYSSVVFGLSKADLVISIPEIPSDYFTLSSYYDPFGDSFANTGSENLKEPGDYLLRRSPDPGTYGVAKANSSDYVAYINSPTTFGIIDIRWLVYNCSSYETIHHWQNETKTTTLTRPVESQQAVSLVEAISSVLTNTTPAEEAPQLLARFAPWCPPTVQSIEPTVSAYLAETGIASGTYSQPSGVNLTVANATALEFAANSLDVPGTTITLSNKWDMLNPNITRNFGTLYGVRTSIALTGYLMLASPNTLYPTFNNDTTTGGLNAATAFTLGANESLLYTFSGRPPLQTTGFWSLTAYQNNLFIPNSLNRSSLGDRSNLTFPDGTPVYNDHGLPFSSTPDGMFQLLIQPAGVVPPSNWSSNWLSGPAGGGASLGVLLPWYDGHIERLTNGSNVYPLITRQGLFTKGTVNSVSTTLVSSAATVSASTCSPTIPTGSTLSSMVSCAPTK